jgi:hypothetical protein
MFQVLNSAYRPGLQAGNITYWRWHSSGGSIRRLGRSRGVAVNFRGRSDSVLSEFPDLSDRAPREGASPSLSRGQRRLERDRSRGYSINVKQVVLAFAVEFWIIGLIIVGTYLLIAESEQLSGEAIFGALLFPAALSMVELARVPLAIAVRTQDGWHIKTLAALGVIAAITVTSFSLSQIAWKTFDNRIADANRASDKLTEAKSKKDTLQSRASQSQHDIDQKIAVRNSVNERLGGLEAQLTKISSSTVVTSKLVIGPDGKPIFNDDGRPVTAASTSTSASQNQLNALRAQIASTKKELEIAEAALRQAGDEAKKADSNQVDAEIVKAEAEYRAAVNKSQLHSYTAMVKGKAVSDVTDSEVKSFEKYLIIIPSIAAALASTLIAITAVRRIKPPDSAPIASIPDEAVAYLFGPLIQALRTEANDAVAAAMKANAKTNPNTS